METLREIVFGLHLGGWYATAQFIVWAGLIGLALWILSKVEVGG